MAKDKERIDINVRAKRSMGESENLTQRHKGNREWTRIDAKEHSEQGRCNRRVSPHASRRCEFFVGMTFWKDATPWFSPFFLAKIQQGAQKPKSEPPCARYRMPVIIGGLQYRITPGAVSYRTPSMRQVPGVETRWSTNDQYDAPPIWAPATRFPLFTSHFSRLT